MLTRSSIYLILLTALFVVPASAEPDLSVASAEARALGILRYKVSFDEGSPTVTILGAGDALLGSVRIEFGTEPERQILTYTDHEGEILRIDWDPHAGRFQVRDDVGEGTKTLGSGGWEGTKADEQFLAEHREAIALIAVTAADYRRNTGQGRPLQALRID